MNLQALFKSPYPTTISEIRVNDRWVLCKVIDGKEKNHQVVKVIRIDIEPKDLVTIHTVWCRNPHSRTDPTKWSTVTVDPKNGKILAWGEYRLRHLRDSEK